MCMDRKSCTRATYSGPFLWRKLTLPTPATFKCQNASSAHYWHFDWLDLVQATRATEFISAMAPLCVRNACLVGILPNFRLSSRFALFHNVSQAGRMCDRKVPFQVALHSSLISALWPAVSFYIHHQALMKVYGSRDNAFRSYVHLAK